VDLIAGNCGADCKKGILSRDAGLPRGCVIRVAEMSAEVQRQFIDYLRKMGKPPRGKREGPATLRVSAEPAAMVEDLIEFLGWTGRRGRPAPTTALEMAGGCLQPA